MTGDLVRANMARAAAPDKMRDESGVSWVLPQPEADLLAEFQAFMAARGDTELLDRIGEGWLPTRPAEVAVALKVLANDSTEEYAGRTALEERVAETERRLADLEARLARGAER